MRTEVASLASLGSSVVGAAVSPMRKICDGYAAFVSDADTARAKHTARSANTAYATLDRQRRVLSTTDANRSSTFQKCNRFDVRGMRKHIHDPGRLEREPLLLDRSRQIAGEGCWITGDIDDLLYCA